MRNEEFLAKEARLKIMGLSACFAPWPDTNNYLIIVFTTVYIFEVRNVSISYTEERERKGTRARERERRKECS